MGKLVLDLAVSLDGFIEGPKGEIDWCIMDEEMDFNAFLSGIGCILYGRVSYDKWGNFQPSANSTEAEKALWKGVHSKKKYVFSSRHREDSHASFITSDIGREVARMKEENEKDIWLYGGSKLIQTFLQLELVDIFRISVHPIVLGAGKPLFEDPKGSINLQLLES